MKTSMQPDENSGPIFHFSTFASVVGACPQDDARVFRSNFLAWYDAFCIPGTLILVVHLSNLTWPSKSGAKDWCELHLGSKREKQLIQPVRGTRSADVLWRVKPKTVWHVSTSILLPESDFPCLRLNLVLLFLLPPSRGWISSCSHYALAWSS